MYIRKVTKENTDIKTGELYTDILPYNKIINSKIADHVRYDLPTKKLRYCKAATVEDGMYIYLISYCTVVAMIDRHTGILYDFLRTEYGYTATSAYHISKFYNDFPAFSIVRYTN